MWAATLESHSGVCHGSEITVAWFPAGIMSANTYTAFIKVSFSQILIPQFTLQDQGSFIIILVVNVLESQVYLYPGSTVWPLAFLKYTRGQYVLQVASQPEIDISFFVRCWNVKALDILYILGNLFLRSMHFNYKVCTPTVFIMSGSHCPCWILYVVYIASESAGTHNPWWTETKSGTKAEDLIVEDLSYTRSHELTQSTRVHLKVRFIQRSFVCIIDMISKG